MRRPVCTAILLLLAAAPATAQVVPVIPPMPEYRQGDHPLDNASGIQPFRSVSREGRRILAQAMRGDRDADRADQERVRDARNRLLSVLDAPRLDTAALRSALAEERDASTAIRARRQAALAAALERLSVKDRRGFVSDTRRLRDRVEYRLKNAPGRGRLRDRISDRLSSLPPLDGDGLP